MRRPRIASLLALISLSAVLAGCTGGPGPGANDEDGRPFVNVARSAGLDYTIDWGLPPNAHPMAFLGGGIAVGDVNGDGWPDIYLADRNQNALYVNQGDGTFRDETDKYRLWDTGIGRAPAFFDYDNDGDLDLFIGNFVSQSKLYRNDGDRFTNVTAEAGVGISTTVHNVAIADYDQDGWLDIFVGVYGDMATGPAEAWTGAENGELNWLFRNNGDGTFTDVAMDEGLDKRRWSFASAFADYDGDGDLDLYVANDFGKDSLYIREEGGYIERGAQLGAAGDRNGMGAAWFDVDGDGDLDLYVTNIFVPGSDVPSLQGNVLFRNDDGALTDVSAAAGVDDGGWSWDAEPIDIDNDGDLDLYVANGFTSRGAWDLYYDGSYRIEKGRPEGPGSASYGVTRGRYNDTHAIFLDPDSVPPGIDMRDPRKAATLSQGGFQRDRLFVNDGSGRFSLEGHTLNLDRLGDGRAVAVLDYDRDGDLDLVVTHARQNVLLLRNDHATGNALVVTLDPGEGRPAHAFGAKLVATVGDRTLVRHIHGPMGFMSQSEPIAHFGLGDAAQVDELVVTWPWGDTTTLKDIAADERLVVRP